MRRRWALKVTGVVQGVGFRPFVALTAGELGLAGWVRNSPDGVVIEVEGDQAALEAFRDALRHRAPPLAVLDGVDVRELALRGEAGFSILESAGGEAPRPVVPADAATCAACLEEILDPAERRHGYPFTNCTHCGPRYSIIEAVPYDRPNTSMKGFPMCPACAREYGDPRDRRFHAQPIACPACGPRVWLVPAPGGVGGAGGGTAGGGGAAGAPAAGDRATGDPAPDALPVLREVAARVHAGQVVAIKGLGGFQLLADAANQAAVERLRRRKGREAKPLALMFCTLEQVKAACLVDPAEEELLTSPQAPIVLLRRRLPPAPGAPAVAEAVAPGNPRLGVMLPYTPLHHLLMRAVGRPVVCTSGNLSQEPIATDNAEGLARLGDIADAFLLHDRPIVRHVDDSVARVVDGQVQLLRRARGYAPLAVTVGRGLPPLLAVGGYLKNTVALSVGGQVILSQHVGDLETSAAREAHRRVIADLRRFYGLEPVAVACDLHPDYPSTWAAEELAAAAGVPVVRVQHHHAHVAAAMAEHGLEGPVLGVAWDGSGYGPDGTVWGGEFLRCAYDSFERVARLRPFRLPGGERAVEEPRRSALGALAALEWPARLPAALAAAFGPAELRVLSSMLERGTNSPLTSSAGRLFDAVAALAGLRQRNAFEGQAAMELEFAVDPAVLEAGEAYPFPLRDQAEGGLAGKVLEADWEPALRRLLADLEAGAGAGAVSARFHNGLAELVVSVARRAALKRVVLTGGCFQNAVLTAATCRRLRQAGFEPHVHRRVPANDGGIALGQVMVAAARLEEGGSPGVPGHSR